MSFIENNTYNYMRKDKVILCNSTVVKVDDLSAISMDVGPLGPFVRFYITGSDPVAKDLYVKDKYKNNLSDDDVKSLLNHLAYGLSNFIQSYSRVDTIFDIQDKLNKLAKELADSNRLYDTSMYE